MKLHKLKLGCCIVCHCCPYNALIFLSVLYNHLEPSVQVFNYSFDHFWQQWNTTNASPPPTYAAMLQNDYPLKAYNPIPCQIVLIEQKGHVYIFVAWHLFVLNTFRTLNHIMVYITVLSLDTEGALICVLLH